MCVCGRQPVQGEPEEEKEPWKAGRRSSWQKSRGWFVALLRSPGIPGTESGKLKCHGSYRAPRGFGDRARSWCQQLGHYFSDILVKNRKIADSLFILALPQVSRGPDKDWDDF